MHPTIHTHTSVDIHINIYNAYTPYKDTRTTSSCSGPGCEWVSSDPVDLELPQRNWHTMATYRTWAGCLVDGFVQKSAANPRANTGSMQLISDETEINRGHWFKTTRERPATSSKGVVNGLVQDSFILETTWMWLCKNCWGQCHIQCTRGKTVTLPHCAMA